jgi:hypothetical protein
MKNQGNVKTIEGKKSANKILVKESETTVAKQRGKHI